MSSPPVKFLQLFFNFSLSVAAERHFLCERGITIAVTVRAALEKDLKSIGSLYGAVCDALQGRPYNPGWSRDGFPTVDCAREYLQNGALLIALDGAEPAGSVGLTQNPSAGA